MKTTTLVAMAFLGLVTTFTTTAQNNVGIGTTNPDASAVLELESTTQGFLPPRMTEGQRNTIAAPVAAGLIVWCTDCGTDGETQVYNGTVWTNMVGGAASNPIITVQQRLDGVVVPAETPKQIYDSGMPLDSLYGKIYKEGLIAYLNTTNGTGFVAALSDIVGSKLWGCYLTPITGADGTAIGTGYQNTLDIIAGCSTIGIAAEECAAIPLNGGAPWYLPSKDELNSIWDNLADSDGNNINNGPSDPNNLGGFANSNYWSSTEFDNLNAWDQSLYDGYQDPNGNGKNLGFKVRAVRAF